MATVNRKSTGAESLARLIPIFIVLFSIGYAIAAYAFLYIPKLGRLVPGGDLDMGPYNSRLEEAHAYGQKLQSLQVAYDAVNPERRDRVEQMIPAGADTQNLYPIFETLSAQNDMVLTSVSTMIDSKTMTESGRQVVLVNANVAGGKYSQLKAFISALEHEQRILDVQSVVFNASTSSYGIVARAYVFSPSRLTTPPPADVLAPAQAQ